ncbi:LytR/AlgR family response regulator transcription factor [Thermoflexibacter ruber]|uniref:DNA-binding response regulator, LytR/AlgR family n=1 Tax=Thermoflexibacter ruber TaxID=1003 RepID=A0A1I2C3W6_9BACT|nr:LytTR family DNA-binding domain-containing protein [Thermoflexibacter ruber]SFE62925.1 DNA-binding response regulator, LytR/AlgR family [Thermoflexibacter ruber]
MKCLVIDDETPAQILLETYIRKIPELTFVKACSSAIEAMSLMQKENIDLLFLDIQMPDLTGIELIKLLRNKPLTILTTAYSEYALQGYELDIIDYLLKPISFERFFKASAKALEIWTNQQQLTVNNEQLLNDNQQGTKVDYIFIKSGYDILKVEFDTILYIEGMREYTCVYTENQKIMTLISLQRFTEILPSSLFARVHRSYIVNIGKIKQIQGNTIKLGNAEIVISKSFRENFLKMIDRYDLF